jgi:hypothetical protein
MAKALLLACWNADGVRDMKLELEHFLVSIYVFLQKLT